jgi:hypothetical protein
MISTDLNETCFVERKQVSTQEDLLSSDFL